MDESEPTKVLHTDKHKGGGGGLEIDNMKSMMIAKWVGGKY